MKASAFALFLVAACHDKSPPAPIPPDAAASATPASPRPLSNLLLTTSAEVTVSSRVDNPRDFVEHLVDGKPETAWNGRTGDLNAWIELKLDPRVHVDAIRITAGFDKGDLFEKNHRIDRLVIERDGKPLKEVTLDPTQRALQRIPIDGPGGTYRLTVKSSVPGTMAKWKEIVVSDLDVLGDAPAAIRIAPTLPVLRVAPGSAKAPTVAKEIWELNLEGRRGASVAAICEAWRKDVNALGRASWAPDYVKIFEKETSCTSIPTPRIEGPLPGSWKQIAAVERRYFDGVASMKVEDIVVELADGAWLGGPSYSSWNDVCDSPSPITSAFQVNADRLILATASRGLVRGTSPDGKPEPGGQLESTGKVCKVASLKCGELVLYASVREPSAAAFAKPALEKRLAFPKLNASGTIDPIPEAP